VNSLPRKVAVITGGSSGIGLATAKRFVEEGAYVFITGRRKAELDKAVAEIGKKVTAIQSDVSNLADLDRLFQTVEKSKGRIDVLFANAGVVEPTPTQAVTPEHYDRTFDIDTRGVFFDGAEGAAAGERRRLDHSQWIGCLAEGHSHLCDVRGD
jgi:NAD(P)-dependent dehydrogenase (short-subunit alcohol dehydrogenase family)